MSAVRLAPWLLAAAFPAAAAPDFDKADQARALMVERVARFIEWPGPAPSRFAICIAADHPQLEAVKHYYENTSIHERPVALTITKRSDALSGCRVAFLAPREVPDIGRLRAQAYRDNVLLVAEGVDAARNGAHVGFYSDLNRLRLEVNRKALEASGLKASFRLLEVAKVVE